MSKTPLLNFKKNSLGRGKYKYFLSGLKAGGDRKLALSGCRRTESETPERDSWKGRHLEVR